MNHTGGEPESTSDLKSFHRSLDQSLLGKIDSKNRNGDTQNRFSIKSNRARKS